MPVDKDHSRHGTDETRRGRQGLGVATTWNCPGCGKQNTGRTPEQGCLHCGAGDPTKAKGGQAQETGPRLEPEEHEVITPALPSHRVRQVPAAMMQEPSALRIYRLIEYVIRDQKAASATLRNSLVGTMSFAWGDLTGCIVDSTDPQQEDHLRMARMQPGVWLSNPTAMAQQDSGAAHMVAPLVMRYERAEVGRSSTRTSNLNEVPMAETPDTGPQYSVEQRDLAIKLVGLVGYQLAHTLALGLQSIAEELDANIEPEKYITSTDALALANAIMNCIPAQWLDAQQEPPEDATPPPTPPPIPRPRQGPPAEP